jgi:hypothetical protein
MTTQGQCQQHRRRPRALKDKLSGRADKAASSEMRPRRLAMGRVGVSRGTVDDLTER